jgi:hypothetical protein
VALLTAYAQKPVLEAAALQVGLELLLDVLRQRPAGLGTQFAKRRIVLFDEPIQQRRLRPVASIARWAIEIVDVGSRARRRSSSRPRISPHFRSKGSRTQPSGLASMGHGVTSHLLGSS